MPSNRFGEFAMQTANQGVGAILGLLTGQYNDDRQYNQQERLQRLQIQGSKEMTDYQYNKMLQMWKDTNYSAQAEELEKAGLNRALLYGMSGGGGTTAGGGATTTQGAQAPGGGHEIQRGLEMGIQIAMIRAQTRVLETQADKNEAEAEKTKGVDTTETETRIKSLTQGIENAKAQQTMTEVETRIKWIEEHIKGETQNDAVATIRYGMQKIYEEMEMAKNERWISDQVKDEKVKLIEQELVTVAVQNALTHALKTNIAKDTELKDKQIYEIGEKCKTMFAQRSMGWEQLSVEQRKTAVQEMAQDLQQEYALPDRLINVISETIFGIFSGKLGQSTITPNRVGYK